MAGGHGALDGTITIIMTPELRQGFAELHRKLDLLLARQAGMIGITTVTLRDPTFDPPVIPQMPVPDPTMGARTGHLQSQHFPSRPLAEGENDGDF